MLITMIVYIIVTVPLVEWPGSVVKNNADPFIKAAIFYFFTVSLVTTESRLRTLVNVFLATQAFRIVEPLYLNVTDGYWGSATHIGGGQFMDRLSGAPHDIINSNGLAAVIIRFLAMGYFLSIGATTKWKTLFFIGVPACLYALILTASRSGFIVLIVVVLTIIVKNQKKVATVVVLGIFGVVALQSLNPLQVDRYLSIGRGDVRFASTARGRIDSVIKAFEIGLERPIVGHGLGTSFEANFNKVGDDHLTHNLYVEVFQELGIIGFIIFLFFLKSIFKNLQQGRAELAAQAPPDPYFINLLNGLQSWFVMEIVFSLASYGVSTYKWYLLAGISVVVRAMTSQLKNIKRPVLLGKRNWAVKVCRQPMETKSVGSEVWDSTNL